MNQHSENKHASLQNAYGEIPYGMTNDYMFRLDINVHVPVPFL